MLEKKNSSLITIKTPKKEIRARSSGQEKFLKEILNKNKFRVGIRHKANDYVKLDPHIFIQHQRKNDWALEYGPFEVWL